VFALPTERAAGNGFEDLTDDALSSPAANGSPTAWTPDGATIDEVVVTDWSLPSDWSVFPGRPDSGSSKAGTPVEGEDIMEASAATALPTAGDRPAPAAGSELARLLSKVEARLRYYE